MSKDGVSWVKGFYYALVMSVALVVIVSVQPYTLTSHFRKGMKTFSELGILDYYAVTLLNEIVVKFIKHFPKLSQLFGRIQAQLTGNVQLLVWYLHQVAASQKPGTIGAAGPVGGAEIDSV